MVSPLRAGRLTNGWPPAVDFPADCVSRPGAADCDGPWVAGMHHHQRKLLRQAPACIAACPPAIYNNRVERCGIRTTPPFSLAARRITVVGGYRIVALPSV